MLQRKDNAKELLSSWGDLSPGFKFEILTNPSLCHQTEGYLLKSGLIQA